MQIIFYFYEIMYNIYILDPYLYHIVEKNLEKNNH